MKPYYERDGIVIYHADCREVLPTLARESVELLVTDPPYGIDWQSNQRTERFERMAGDDGSLDVTAALSEAGFALRRNRHGYVFGKFEVAFPFVHKADLIWDKAMMGGGDVSSVWGPAHESIMFVFRAADRAKANLNGGGVPARLRRGSILRFPRPNATGIRRHPAEKPVGLLRWLVESSSQSAESVLDPFLGSGSTLVAAILEGRKGIGVEINARYAEIAAARCDVALDAYRTLMEAAA